MPMRTMAPTNATAQATITAVVESPVAWLTGREVGDGLESPVEVGTSETDGVDVIVGVIVPARGKTVVEVATLSVVSNARAAALVPLLGSMTIEDDGLMPDPELGMSKPF